jgi:hypothetical protein
LDTKSLVIHKENPHDGYSILNAIIKNFVYYNKITVYDYFIKFYIILTY